MKSKTEIANFFWHGNPLSLYEQLCISSFIKHGFEVNIWSFMELDIPKGANLKNAEDIISKDHLFKYTQAGKPGNISAFSDVFRFNLMFQKPGEWWFDTDSICLKDASEYAKLKENRRIVVGWEDLKHFSCGIGAMTMPDPNMAFALVYKQKEICELYTNIPWGEIGPRMVTNFCKEHNMLDQFLPVEVFYPIGFYEWDQIYDVKLTEDLLNKTKDAYMTHLWNEVLKDKVNKNELPPKDSFLYLLFEKYFPEVL
jgi:hypothetical protein